MKLVLTVLVLGLCLPLMGDEKGITDHMRDGWQKDLLDFGNQEVPDACLMAFAAFVLFVIGSMIYNLDRCPKCKRRWALETTGTKKGGNWFTGAKEVELKCQYCGARDWRDQSSNGGGD